MNPVNEVLKIPRNWLKSRWIPWIFSGVLLLAGSAILFLWLPSNQIGSLWIRIYLSLVLIIGSILAFILFTRIIALSEIRENLQERLLESEQQTSKALRRLEAMFQVGQKFVDSIDENEVIDLVLQLLIELVGAQGASFVPLDDHSRPIAVTRYGDLPNMILDPWLEYLATPEVRQRCQVCENQKFLQTSCPLLRGQFIDETGIYCIRLRRGDREFGVFNLYTPDKQVFDIETQTFLGTLIDETGLAVEGIRLRRKELTALREMQQFRQRVDPTLLLNNILESILESVDAEIGILTVKHLNGHQGDSRLSIGKVPQYQQSFVEGLIQTVMTSGEPIMIGDIASNPTSNLSLRSLLITPLLSITPTTIGAVLVGSTRIQGFSNRQLTLVQTMASQVAQILQNSDMAADIEYKAIMQERKRLAREIHDGLAQTLGYLKLQAAQIKTYLARGEINRAQVMIEQYYVTLSEAYKDARQAIDGLRVNVDEDGIRVWLEETAIYFQEVSGLAVELSNVERIGELAPEIQAQIMRIVQEALSNVRKHAQARQVWIDCFGLDDELYIEVRDDGTGFLPEDLAGPSRHGLSGMRERADLINADFQVISQPGKGTTIRLRLPIFDQRKHEVRQ